MRKIITILLFGLFLFPFLFTTVQAACDTSKICIQSPGGQKPPNDPNEYFRCSSADWWCQRMVTAPSGCTDQIELKYADGKPSDFKPMKKPWMDVSEACFLKAGIELKNGHPDDLSVTKAYRNICDNSDPGKSPTTTNYNWVICSACYKAEFEFAFFGNNPANLNTSCRNSTGFLGLKDDFNQESRAVREFLEMQGYGDAAQKGQLRTSTDTPVLPTSTSGTYTQPDADPQNKNACNYLMSIPDPDSFEKCDDCMKDGHVWTSLGCIKAADPYAFVGQIITWATILGAGLATAIIGFQGLQIVLNGEDPKKVKASQEAITAAISGLLLIVFSIMLMNILGIKVLNITNLGFWKQP